MMETVVLELKNASKFYISGRLVTTGLNDVSLSFCTGEFVAVTGESGSGKSTLAHILAGIFSCESGEFLVNGESTTRYSEEEWERYRRDKISFVAQNYGILPGCSVMENVLSALYLAGMEREMATAEAEKLLKKVDLWKMKRRRASRLSSGQKQRLSIARALAKPAPVLIADEPTGNLDAGNSRKILELLAEAAGERLVIMVTHDFDMAAEYATRQIVLHDSVVEKDRQLRENVVAAQGVQVQEHKEHHQARLGWYIAGLLLRARPTWSCFMAALFVMTAFAVFAFLGTFVASLDDTPTRIYDNEAFRNGDDTRLVVSKADGATFTQEDYEELLTVSWVTALERYDMAQDVNYYYRPEEDYSFRYAIGNDVYAEPTYSESVIFKKNDSFVRTVPLLKGGEPFLKAGSLPEHMNEVVAVGDESMIGTVIPVRFQDSKNWGAGFYVYQEMTVVGVTDFGKGLYFDDRIGKMLSQYLNEDFSLVYGVDETLEKGEITVTETLMNVWRSRGRECPETMNVRNFSTGEQIWLHVAGTNKSNWVNYVEMSEEDFDELSRQENCIQVSLFLQDYSYADRAMSKIRELGYEVLSPYRISSVKVDEKKADARLSALVMCMVALIVVVAAQCVVLSAMFGLEMKSFEQLGNLGLLCKCGQFAILWQVLFLAVIGQILGFAMILIGGQLGVRQFGEILKYLTPLHGFAMSGVHLAASLLVALAGCIMLRNRVFPFSRSSAEVDLSELEEEEDA